MANKFFRDRLLISIAGAVRSAQQARALDHPGMVGRLREIAVQQLFEPLFPSNFAIGTGKIVDSQGRESAQTDLVVYSPALVAPLFYAPQEGLFPVETCFFAIEVKSRLDRSTMEKVVENARRIGKLQPLLGGRAVPTEGLIPSLLFAFETDLKNSTEFDRYCDIDANAYTNPALSSFCVAGRGYWMFSRRPAIPSWVSRPTDIEHEEVLDWLGSVVHSLPDQLEARGRPTLGSYLWDDPEYTSHPRPADGDAT